MSGVSPFFVGSKFVPSLLGEWLLNETSYKTLKGSGRMYRYERGVYLPDGKEHLKGRCVNMLKDDFNTARMNETISFIEASTYTESNSCNYINLENGLLDPITRELKDHTPDIFSTVRIPINYDPEAGCDTFLEKLNQKVDSMTIDVLQEFFGYCFIPRQKYQKALLLYGPRRTMKSTVLNVLIMLLGQKNITGFPLTYLNDNEFALAYIYGKAANVCADLPAASLKNTGRFMTITGGDLVSAGRKHEHPIDFHPSAKLIFSCNQIPSTTNKDLAFYRRWVILGFDKITPVADIDENLPAKLVDELPGILNWALDGLKRLELNGQFSYWLDEEGVKDMYERNSDSVNSFIYGCVNTEDDQSSILKRDVYKAYIQYCRHNRLNPVNQIRFGREFKAYTGCGTTTRDKIPAYKGVSLLDANEVSDKYRQEVIR